MKRFLAFAALSVLIFAVASRLLAQNPAVGTWKLNVAKSKYSPGPGPKSMTRTVESQGAKVKYSFEGIRADGSTVAYSYTVSYDGNDYPSPAPVSPPTRTASPSSSSTPTPTKPP